MLSCICSVIDNRWWQNVVRTKKWHTRRQLSVSLMFLPHFDILCDLLLNRRMTTWNLFVLYNKETETTAAFLFQNFSQLLESWPLPTLVNTKKAIWHNLLFIQNEAISLLAMRSKELWFVQKNHATVKLDSNGFSWSENLQWKQNWTAKSTNLKENVGKIKSSFVIQAAL